MPAKVSDAARELPQGSWEGAREFFEQCDSAVGGLAEIVSAILLAAEIAILLAGVIARYVLHRPLVWSDELASILFLWLGMLGSAIAIRRGDHLRMLTVVNRLPSRLRVWAEPFAVAVVAAFLLFTLPAALDNVRNETDVSTATLEISSAWRAAALPVGIALMIFFSVMPTLRMQRTPVLLAAATVLAGCAILILLRPYVPGIGRGNLVIFFLGLMPFLVFAGVPIAFAFGAATYGYLALATRVPVLVLVARIDAGMSNFILLSIPLFILLGLLIEMTGMAATMVRFLASLIGHVRGGLHFVLIAAMYLVSGISGSKAADMAAVAPALFPEMEKRGADRAELAALLGATGAQTETIPPSLILITIGSVTGVSIAALFIGGLLPGLVVGLVLCALVWLRARRTDMTRSPRPAAGEIARAFIVALPALALPFVIRTAVIKGVATATEVSTIGIVYSLVVGLLLYRRFDWRQMGRILVQAAALAGAILIIVGAATGMAWAITQSGFSTIVAGAIGAVPGGKASFIALSILLFAILGSVLEGLPAVVLFGPLMFPIARHAGVHEVHYAMIVILAMGVGLFTPKVAGSSPVAPASFSR